jgi:hypothetical protein
MSRKRQKNQYELAFMAETGSEAPTNDRRVELPMAKQEPESEGLNLTSRTAVYGPVRTVV